jgi:glycosyltransferase involved in cell wall biosynthesis
LWLGRAVPRKRLDLFLDGMRELRRRRPNVRARLVGNLRGDAFADPLVNAVRDDATFSVEGAVARTAVPELFGEIDVLVQTSENENFGFSVAESLAAGRPVVLGPTNGTADYAGEAGFVFTRYEPSAVADALERAMDAVIEQGAALSEKARREARAHFAPDTVMDRFVAVCRELSAC